MQLKLKDFIPPILIKILTYKKKTTPVYFNVDSSGKEISIGINEILKENESLKNIHQGKRCFIVGAGSSIKKQNLKLLKNEITFGLNEFFLHPDYKEIKPKYLIFSGFGIHNVPVEKQLLWYKNYEDKIAGISTPIINVCDHNFISKNKLLSKIDKKFIQYESNLETLSGNGIDATKSLYACQGVGAMAIQVAMYMGFKEIILLGFDHDWLLRMFDNKPTHFYDHNNSIIYKGHSEVKGMSVLYQLDSLSKLFMNYTYLKNYADDTTITVANATEGGMLDVFPLVKYESLF